MSMVTEEKARRLISSKYKDVVINRVTRFGGHYFFEVELKDGDHLLIGGVPFVDGRTGKIGTLSPTTNPDYYKKYVEFLRKS